METHKSHLWKLEGYRCSRTDCNYLSLESGRDTTSNKTTMKYLLDTDWIINLLAGNKDAEEQIQHLDPEEIVICLATVGEIYEGAYSYANPQAHLHTSRQFLGHFQLLNLNLPIMETFAEIRFYLRRRGELI